MDPKDPVKVPPDVKTKDTIETDEIVCTAPQGHCWGSLVREEVWTLSGDKTDIEEKGYYDKCKYCNAYTKAGDVEEK